MILLFRRERKGRNFSKLSSSLADDAVECSEKDDENESSNYDGVRLLDGLRRGHKASSLREKLISMVRNASRAAVAAAFAARFRANRAFAAVESLAFVSSERGFYFALRAKHAAAAESALRRVCRRRSIVARAVSVAYPGRARILEIRILMRSSSARIPSRSVVAVVSIVSLRVRGRALLPSPH